MTGVRAYVDGACRGNPGPGGWGVVIDGDVKHEISGATHHTTNNQMELTAAIEALKLFNSPVSIHIFTDSTYVKNGITNWIHGWKVNGWKNASNKPVKNKELWEELDQLCQKHQVRWLWITGQSGYPDNDRAYQLANKAIDDLLG